MTNVTNMRGVLELVERIEPEVPVMVNLAYQPDLEREVIIKRMTPAAAADPRLRGRFSREARMLAGLHHHGIVQVYDAALYDQLPYVVMEQLDGITVQQRLDFLRGQRQHMVLDEVARIVREVAGALEYAHQYGVLANDLSLDNIVLTSDGRTVLAGLARPLPENLLTTPSAELAFVAPERLFGGAVDARSDVYAIGVLLYTLVTGRLPFEGAAVGVLAQKQGSPTLPALDDPRTELPCSRALVQVMRQATAREADARFATMAAFRGAFDAALDGAKTQFQLLTSGPVSVRALRKVAPARRRSSALDRYGKASATLRAAMMVAAAEPVVVVEDEGVLIDEPAPLEERAVGEPLLDIPPRSARQEAPTLAPTMPAVPAPAAVPSSAPVVVAVAPAAVDALMPGVGQPALQAALPYTLLVPMGEGAEQKAAPVTVSAAPASALSLNLWLAAMIALGALAVAAALTLG